MRILLLYLLAATACGGHPPASHPPAASENSFVVMNTRLFDGQQIIERTNVVVRDSRISEIGSASPSGLAVIDGTGRTLLPGLIDAHAHVRNETHLHDALQYGVTTLLDMMMPVDLMQVHRGQRDSMVRTELADLFSAGAPITSAGGMGTQFGIPFPTLSSPEDAPAFVRARLAEGSDYIKLLYEPDAGIVTTISDQTLAAAIKAAHEQGALTTVHVTSLAGAHAAVAARADGLAHIFGEEPIDESLIREIVNRHVFVTATLVAHAYLGGQSTGGALASDPRIASYLTDKQRAQLTKPSPPPESPMAPYLKRFDVAQASDNVRRLHEAGVTILAGDDAPNFGAHGVALHGELELLVRAGLSPTDALTAATLGPARAFRLADRGRIAVGARADLLLVEGNPTVDITSTRAIVHVWKNGYEVERIRH